MVGNDFTFFKTPVIYFGIGKINSLPKLVKEMGDNVLIISGSNSFTTSIYYKELINSLYKLNINLFEAKVNGEPSPSIIDAITQKFKGSDINVVVGIGGGSAIDAGKAVSAMLPQEGSVLQYLEGIETRKHNGIKVPFIAVPTSSGTGSEATKNAVLSEIGKTGFKSSLRHDNFIPDLAIIDPELTLSCPPNITSACGLDALTQLLEAYVSTKASPMTDALALCGIEHFNTGFLESFLNGSTDILAREKMCYASMISGIVLSNAGLGTVHGFASSIGGFFNIPHGVVCGTLLAETTKINIQELIKNKEQNIIALNKYGKVGVILSGKQSATLIKDCYLLIEKLEELLERTSIPKLSHYGISVNDISKIISKTTNKNNPIALNEMQLTEIIKNRI
jgi:alcohol dehydrogenase class IV